MILIELREVLMVIALVLLTFGICYTVIIYQHPFSTGWTWLSVFVGDLVNDLCVTAAIIATLGAFGLLERLWWMAAFPVAGHILDGGPMIVGQIIKWVAQKRRNRELDKEI